jgi:cytochrome c-type biogenesis protein
MGEWFQQTAGSGSMALAIPVAVIAGLVSFFSPCVIPLLPGYLSYATGLSGADIASGDAHRGRMLAGALLFVAGFTAVFVSLGVASASVAVWVNVNRGLLNTVLGVICILLGIAFLGFLPLLQRDVRIHRVPAVGLAAAPLLGAFFAIGWAPCVGPTFGVIWTLAISQGTAPRGGLLMGFYSLGLGVPFILAALAWRRAMGAIKLIRRHQTAITRFGGGVLVLVGVLLVSGLWDQATTWMQLRVVNDFEVGV